MERKEHKYEYIKCLCFREWNKDFHAIVGEFIF